MMEPRLRRGAGDAASDLKGPEAGMLPVGAAPAGGVRTPALGRPWVAVRPYYGGLPFNGWTRHGRRRAKARRIGLSQKPPGSAPGSYGPRDRKAATERREAPAHRKMCGKTEDWCAAWRSIPLVQLRGQNGKTAYPGPAKNTGDDACVLCKARANGDNRS